MKKVLLSLAAILSFGYAAQAQVSIIPKVGANYSKMIYKKPESFGIDGNIKYKTGLAAGVAFNIPISSIFSLQPEVLYSQKGFMNSNTSGSEYDKITYNYIDIPLLGKISFGNETIKGYVTVGPSASILMNGKWSYKNEAGETGSMKIKFDEGESTDNTIYVHPTEVNGVDLGVQFGGGIDLSAGPGSVLLDFRYSYGLSDLHKKATNPIYSTEADGRHRVFALTVGYAIPLGGK